MVQENNVINLGILDPSTILPSGQKCTYYIYYKADGDLYMYDSYKDIETNLFNLTIPASGKLKIYAQTVLRGVLDIYALKSNKTRLSITAYAEGLINPPSAGITVQVLQEVGTGILDITALVADAGDITVQVLEDV